jgi:hypothetical protein
MCALQKDQLGFRPGRYNTKIMNGTLRNPQGEINSEIKKTLFQK